VLRLTNLSDTIRSKTMKMKLLAGLSAAVLALVVPATYVEAASRQGQVVAMIKAQAPRMGVPTWFALRIAQVESGYNPRARGQAGELGVFQMKCQTARGLGFRGSCGQLLHAATGVHWGLKHLQVAVRASRGDLKLAASKHNGGLGRKSLVRKYVNRVF
jgi:soluble lytic murein transglycosylase-like protein